MNKILLWIRGNIYQFVLFVIAITALSDLFGVIPGLVGTLVLILGVYKITNNISLNKNKKIFYSILICIVGVIIAVILSIALSALLKGYIDSPHINSNNDDVAKTQVSTSTISNKTFKSFSIYSMTNGLKVSYPNDWIAEKGDNEYVVDLSSKDNQTIVEVSYNIFENNEAKDVNKWKTELLDAIKANPKSGIDQSSIVIKNFDGNSALVFNQVTDMNYVSQAIFPIQSSGNKKYIQFTLNVNKANHVATDSRDIFNQIIAKTLEANN